MTTKLHFIKNGASQGTISTISGVTYGIFASDYNNKVAELNTGSPPYSISSGNTDGNGYGNFEYAVPSGYYALNTKNLSGVWIMAYTTIDDPQIILILNFIRYR